MTAAVFIFMVRNLQLERCKKQGHAWEALPGEYRCKRFFCGASRHRLSMAEVKNLDKARQRTPSNRRNTRR